MDSFPRIQMLQRARSFTNRLNSCDHSHAYNANFTVEAEKRCARRARDCESNERPTWREAVRELSTEAIAKRRSAASSKT